MMRLKLRRQPTGSSKRVKGSKQGGVGGSPLLVACLLLDAGAGVLAMPHSKTRGRFPYNPAMCACYKNLYKNQVL